MIRNLLIVGLVTALTATASAQEKDDRGEPTRTPFYGHTENKLITLLTKPGVQQEIGLAESESQKLLDSLRKINPTSNSFPEVRQQRIAESVELHLKTKDEITRRSEAALQESLSENQLRRLHELDLQRQGGRALLNLETAKQLELTAEQQEKLKKINLQSISETRFSRASIAAGAPLPTDAEESVRREKLDADLMAVLTPEQVKQLSTMTGAPLKISRPIIEPPWRLVAAPEVQKELGLSEDEAAALRKSLETIQKEVIAEAGGTIRPNVKDSELRRQFEETIDTVRSSLTVSQWNRLQELFLQETGATSFVQPDVANKLGLTREQRNQVSQMVGEYHRGLIPARQPKEKTEVLNILTPEQTKQWEAMQGAKVDPSIFRSRSIPAKQ